MDFEQQAQPQRKAIKFNFKPISQSSTRTDLSPAKLTLKSSFSGKVSEGNQCINYAFLLIANFLEPSLYCLSYILYKNKYKLASMIGGYILFCYFLSIYILCRFEVGKVKKCEQVLLYIGFIGSAVLTFVAAESDQRFGLYEVLPLVCIKAFFLINVATPLLWICFCLGCILIYGIVIFHLESIDIKVLNYVQACGFYLVFVIGMFWSYAIQKKKPIQKSDPINNHNNTLEMNTFSPIDSAFRVFEVFTDGVVLTESGSFVFSNDAFHRIFTKNECGGILQDKSGNSMISKLSKVKNVKAKNPAIQNRMNDMLKSDITSTPRDASLSKANLKYLDSPDFIVHSERDVNLFNLYLHFSNHEKLFKQNNIGYDSANKISVLESFEGVLDEAPINFYFGYFDLSEKSYLCIIFNDSSFKNEVKTLKNEIEAYQKIPQYVAHEMRNPLGAAHAFLEITDSDSALHETLRANFIAPTIKIIRYTLSLVNDLLDAGQIAAGKFKTVLAPVNLNEVVNNVFGIFDFKAQAKDVSLIKAIDSRLPVEIGTDPARLSQILINLVSNSLKYSQKKGTITVRVEPNVLNSKKIDFYVEDTGLGIRGEDQKELLKDWGRIERFEDSKLNPESIGLGLSICNKLANQLNVEGSQEGIKIDSVFGKGTKIKFSVENKKFESLKTEAARRLSVQGFILEKRLSENYSPSFEEKKSIEAQQKKLDYTSGIELKKIKKAAINLTKMTDVGISQCHCLKALIVDDDVFSASSLVMLLNSFKIEADVCQNTNEALEVLERNPSSSLGASCRNCKGYRIIFMDGLMEGMNGFDSTILLKEKMKKNEIKDIPIVFCTGLDENEESRAKRAGASFFMTKPISKINLEMIIKQLNIYNVVVHQSHKRSPQMKTQES